MKDKKNDIISIKKPKSKNPYLWKYYDLHKFIYLLTNQKIFFTRLDNLDDPFEGLSTKFLRDNHKNAKSEAELDHLYSLNKESKEEFEKLKEFNKVINSHMTSVSQTKQYVSCWFNSDRESMAMWNLYSNQDLVAIKVNFEILRTCITESFADLAKQNENKISIIGDEIKYLKLNPFDENLKMQSLNYSALKKDKSYSYENEYRFLIISNDNELKPNFFSVPINLEKLEMTILTHPKMENWKFDNLNELLKLTNQKIKLIKSPIVLK